jgi:PAS domain S-box-containing protein
VFTRDITKRRQAEDMLRRSEQQFRALFDQVQNAVLLADDDGRFIDANPAACALFRFPCEKLIGKSIVNFAPPGNRLLVKESWQQFLQTGTHTGEFVLQHGDGTTRTLEYRARADVRPGVHISILRDITDQRRAENQAHFLFENLREERDTLDTVNRIGRLLSGELDLQKLVQAATDAATELTGAQFGAFFYNTVNQHGESLLLYTISGAPLEAFSRFPHPRATPLFGPTFRAEGIIRISDVTNDARYGHMAPHFGMPEGHLPVKSYLAVPVVSRSGEVLGGLFFGHEDAGVFSERAERNLVALVAQVAIAVDNARLYEKAQRGGGGSGASGPAR